MTFSQKSDVKKHIAGSTKKTHNLTLVSSEPTRDPSEKDSAGGAGGTATLLDDREPILVAGK
jgi:hypothetical protein